MFDFLKRAKSIIIRYPEVNLVMSLLDASSLSKKERREVLNWAMKEGISEIVVNPRRGALELLIVSITGKTKRLTIKE